MASGEIREFSSGGSASVTTPNGRLVREQADLLVRQARVGVGAALAAATLIALPLMQAVGWRPILMWWLALAASVALRQSLLERAQASGSLDRVLRVTVIGAAVLGLLVTAPAPLYFDDLDTATRAFLSMFYVAWAAGAVTVLGIHPVSYRVFLLCTMGSLALAWWLAGHTQHAVLVTVGLGVLGALMARLATGVGRLIEESVNIRHERDELVKRLEQSLAETDAAQRARSQFLASASHDLLQPVHALMLLAGLARDMPDGPRREDALRQLNTTADAIDAMFRGLLDFARFDAGMLRPQLTAMPVAHVLSAVHAAYRARCAEKGVVLTVDVAPGIHVQADPSMFDRVLRNLVDNAVKFTPSGEITVRCRSDGHTVTVEVQDTGVGISEADLAHVQEAFFRGASARLAEADGVGLGLANSTQMARLQHGDISLRSTPGQGTTVTFSLPAAAPMAGPPTSAQPLPALGYRSIVLVEDDRTARAATELWLRMHGAEVVAEADAASALEACDRRSLKPDFLLCDYQLGDGATGVQAIALLRERFGPLPAAIVSGETPAPTDLPVDVPLLSKPLRPQRLLELLS